MSIFTKRGMIILLFLSLTAVLIAIGYRKYEHYMMSRLPTKIVYESDSLLKNPVLYINNLNHKNAYLEYIEKKSRHDSLIPINFPLLYIPGGEKIYIRKFLDDSLLVEFFNPDSRKGFEGFTTGYVHKKFIHQDTSLKK